jgi:ribosomal protein S18 acetylase RimI-like enzyme
LASEVYAHYFATYWEGNGLEIYLENQFGKTQLEADINNPFIETYLINRHDHPIGFLKFKLNVPLEGLQDGNGCELEKLYLHPDHSGKGIGQSVLQQVVEIVCKRKNSFLFLHVVDTNYKAIQFYENFGFKHHGKTRLDIPQFKDALRGLFRMVLEIR